MEWRLISHAELAALPAERRFPWSTGEAIAFGVRFGDGREPQLFALNQAAEDAPDPLPFGVYAAEDLRDRETWKTLLALGPVHRCELAAYQARFSEDIPEETLLEALGQKPTFKTLADWREWAQLDELSQKLARRYDPPLGALRLWNRLPDSERRVWLDIWTERVFRKNLIRDIIIDYYDLVPQEREEVLGRAADFAAGWNGKSAPFPADEIRDMVRARRMPAFMDLRRKVYHLKKNLGLSRGVQLDIPEDLEDPRLTLRVDFESVEELDRQLEQLQSDDFQRGLARILQTL